MAVSDLILVAGLKRAVGIAYLQKLLGLAMNSASALQKKAERLRNAHAKLCNKLRKAKPEACVAEVDAWLAGADKSPANTPRDKKNCSCEACGAVVRNKPLITPAKPKSHHKQQPDLTNGAARWRCSEKPSSVRSLCERSSRGFPQERQPSFLLTIYAA